MSTEEMKELEYKLDKLIFWIIIVFVYIIGLFSGIAIMRL